MRSKVLFQKSAEVMSEHPEEQGIDVGKVIVEGLSALVAALHDLRNGHLVQGQVSGEREKRLGQLEHRAI